MPVWRDVSWLATLHCWASIRRPACGEKQMAEALFLVVHYADA